MYLFTLNRIYFTFPFYPLKYLIKTQQFTRSGPSYTYDLYQCVWNIEFVCLVQL